MKRTTAASAASPGPRTTALLLAATLGDLTAMTWDDPSTLQFGRCP